MEPLLIRSCNLCIGNLDLLYCNSRTTPPASYVDHLLGDDNLILYVQLPCDRIVVIRLAAYVGHDIEPGQVATSCTAITCLVHTIQGYQQSEPYYMRSASPDSTKSPLPPASGNLAR